MAHTTVSFSLGLLLGGLLSLRPLLRAWRGGRRLAARLRTALLLSYGLGCFAITPSLLRRLGLPESVWGGWWMNLFLFHPLADRLRYGDTFMGPAALLACFTLHYAVLLAALRRARRTRPGPP